MGNNERNRSYLRRLYDSQEGITADRKLFEAAAPQIAGEYRLRDKFKVLIAQNSSKFRDSRGNVTPAKANWFLDQHRRGRARDRLSNERVQSLLQRLGSHCDHNDVNRVASLASHGYFVHRPENFRPSCELVPFFESKPGLQCAFERSIEKFVERGDIVLVDTSVLIQVPNVNLLHAHIVPKEGPPGSARAVLDASRGSHAINSSEDRETIRQVWGKQSFPSMIGIARQCHGTFLEHGTDSAAAVEDIDSAYHQIDVAQCDQWVQCCSFSSGVSGIWVSGFFGSNVAGSAFGATGRLALADIRKNGAPHRATAATSTIRSPQTPVEAGRSRIRCSLVVDDALVTGHRDEIVPSITGSAQEVGGIDYVQQVFRDFYGPTAVSGKKTRVAIPSRPSGEVLRLNNGASVENSGSEITYIGWILDFARGGFGVKLSNIARTVRTLVSVINDGTVSVHTLLRASAQVCRLQMVISPLRLVSRALASQVFMSRDCYWRNLEAKITVQASTRQAARLALSWIVDFAERDARTPFRSLAALNASWLIVSDASSKGFGWLIYRRKEPVDELAECENYHEFCSDNESAAAEVRTDQEIARVVEECHNDGVSFDIGRIDSRFELIAAGALPMPYDIMAILGAEEKPSKKFKSGLQNTWEFLAHTMAMAALGFCGVSSTSVSAVFDSVTAKKWSSGVTTGRLSRIAMLLHAAVSLDCELTVAKTVCIGTLDMHAADLLSREDPAVALEQLGIPKEKWLFPTQRLVELLDPSIEWPENDDAEFLRLWQRARDAAKSFTDSNDSPLFSRSR